MACYPFFHLILLYVLCKSKRVRKVIGNIKNVNITAQSKKVIRKLLRLMIEYVNWSKNWNVFEMIIKHWKIMDVR